jgi:hypothetical protein
LRQRDTQIRASVGEAIFMRAQLTNSSDASWVYGCQVMLNI